MLTRPPSPRFLARSLPPHAAQKTHPPRVNQCGVSSLPRTLRGMLGAAGATCAAGNPSAHAAQKTPRNPHYGQVPYPFPRGARKGHM